MTTAAQDRARAPSPDGAHPFAVEMLHFDDQPLRVGRQAGSDAGVPLLLVGPQFTEKCPDAARYERFVKIIDDIGARDRVPVLDRYAIMKRWRADHANTLGALLSQDGLHMSDLGYRCLAHILAETIESAAGAKL